jgi:hypothetical protein
MCLEDWRPIVCCWQNNNVNVRRGRMWRKEGETNEMTFLHHLDLLIWPEGFYSIRQIVRPSVLSPVPVPIHLSFWPQPSSRLT